MHDLIIRAGSVVDGTGSAARTADVAITDGIISEVGRVDGPARRELDADGLLVTPGFVDIHTHFDGQVTWDPMLTPTCWHGVTTVVMGNCGVGFAPVHPDRHDWLIGLMEGVEDIPGAALSDGIRSLLKQALGVDDSLHPPLERDQVRLRPPALLPADREAFEVMLGAEYCRVDDDTRLLHAGGKSTLDLLRRRDSGDRSILFRSKKKKSSTLSANSTAWI